MDYLLKPHINIIFIQIQIVANNKVALRYKSIVITQTTKTAAAATVLLSIL